MQVARADKSTVKGVGFNLQPFSSEKGKKMIDAQRDSRRQRHLQSYRECEKFLEQFYDNFMEKKSEIKEKVNMFLSASDEDVQHIMAELTDEALLAHEIDFVNAAWEKVTVHHNARKDHLDQTLDEFKELQDFQQKNSGQYWNRLKEELTETAFLLEPAVIELVDEWKAKEELRYKKEHEDSYAFHQKLVEEEKEKHNKLKQEWEDRRIRFHVLKQEHALKTFQERIDSPEFVNPEERIELFDRLKHTQIEVYRKRMAQLKDLDNTNTPSLTAKKVEQVATKLDQINDEAQEEYDDIAAKLTDCIKNSNREMDTALENLRDFLHANKAQIEEGMTYDIIIEEQALPFVNRRKQEAQELYANAYKYLEELDDKMNEICKNIIEFLKKLAKKYDKGKDDLKNTELQFNIKLAQCADNNYDAIDDQEESLSKNIDEMRKAIHHVELNQKLNECFDQLDAITKSYRNYNKEYCEIVENYPDELETFYEKFERNCAECFKLLGEEKREEIKELFEKETAERQRKLEEEALRKYEEEKRLEELKAKEEEEKNPKGGAKKAPPKAAPKKGKDADKPDLNVPQLQVPQIQEFKSKSGYKYLVKRSTEEIATELMQIKSEESEKEGEGEEDEKQPEEKAPVPPPAEPKKEAAEEGEGEDKDKEVPKEPVNPYLENTRKIPPQDPDGNKVLEGDLIIKHSEIKGLLDNFFGRMFNWISEQKQDTFKQMRVNNKELIDSNIDELDENLRKQWPRKGKLEVEVYQERKSQITAHNKKYERQIRQCLERHNKSEEMWAYLMEKIEREFEGHDRKQDKIKQNIPECKNLAELQGTSRKERDSIQSFEEKITEITDKLYDIAVAQSDALIKLNSDMLKSCQLFGQGGNYSELEIEWYRKQMDEINEMLQHFRQEKENELENVNLRLKGALTEPYEKFEAEYKSGMHSLVAKEGLGKKFGAPRRIIQERMRAEMTKCEQAQSGIENLLDKLGQLCGEWIGDQATSSLSIEIRKVQICIMRCIIRYGKYLNAFRTGDQIIRELKELDPISLIENKETLELTEEEKATYEDRKERELFHLNTIGTPQEENGRFTEKVEKINSMAIEHCQKLYVGEDAKWLVGDKKIPEYLNIYLKGVNTQAEEFRIQSVRYLREASLEYIQLCEKVPSTVFCYIEEKYSTRINQAIQAIEREYNQYEREDKELRAHHLKRFRPNLANPANAEELEELNKEAKERTEKFMDKVDETQIQLVDLETEKSNEFYIVYLNNLRCLLKLYNALVYKEHFIKLPGDEIEVKKKLNIRVLTAKYQGKDLSTQPKRKWKGLGPNPFKVDLTKYDTFAEFAKPEVEKVQEEPEKPKGKDAGKKGVEEELPKINEIAEDIEIENTAHHKAIIKNRNEYFEKFTARFKHSFDRIMKKYDDIREEEENYNEYWEKNYKELRSRSQI